MKILNFLFLGIITAFGSLVVEIFFFPFRLESSLTSSSLSWAFLAAPFIEELMKGLILTKKFFQEKLSGNFILKSLFFGAGFFLVELIMNLYQNAEFSLFLPLLGVLGIHELTSVIIGYSLSKSNYPYLLLISAMIFNILLHLSYNLIIIHF